MKKIKKIFISLSVFISVWIKKVFAVDSFNIDMDIDTITQTAYGDPVDTDIFAKGNIFTSIKNFIIFPIFPIITFLIGLFTILNKKFSKMKKIIICEILVIILLIYGLLIIWLDLL